MVVGCGGQKRMGRYCLGMDPTVVQEALCVLFFSVNQVGISEICT